MLEDKGLINLNNFVPEDINVFQIKCLLKWFKKVPQFLKKMVNITHMNIIKFFYINAPISYKNVTVRKIDVSEGIDTNKTSLSKECMLYHYWCFIDVRFKFEPHVWNKYNDVFMTAYELKHIAILNVKGVGFRCILWGISRDEAANRLNNSVLGDKGVL